MNKLVGPGWHSPELRTHIRHALSNWCIEAIFLSLLMSLFIFPSTTLALTNSEIQSLLVQNLYGGAGGRVSCDFDGYSSPSKGRHEGIDFVIGQGEPIYALISGTITNTRNQSSHSKTSLCGIYDSENNKTVVYLHGRYVVSSGSTVSKGQLIGYEDNYGAGSPHTHVEVVNGWSTYAKYSLISSNAEKGAILENDNPYPYWEKVLGGTPDLSFECCIDNPSDWQSFNGNLYVQGWAIWKTPPSRILYSINGGSETILSFYYRDDVHNAYPAYPTDNNGWRGYIPNASFRSGANTITFTADFGGERKSIGSLTVNNTYAGQPPAVSDVRITNVTTDGYTVTCKVAASNGLDCVEFPTWTVLDGQDDITWDYKKVSGNTATVGYNVKVESHAYRHGLYCTHVYARDQLGYQSPNYGIANNIIVPTAMTETENSTYLLVDTEALRGDWLQTRDVVASSWQARNLGAHLVSITLQEEQDVVAELAYARDGKRFGYWMGLTKTEDGEFTWTSGEEVDYTNWSSDQPAVADNKHYGALMWETGKWENLTRTATSSGYVVDGVSNMGFIVEVPDGGGVAVLSDPEIAYDGDGEGLTAKVKVRPDANVEYVQFATWTDSDQVVRWFRGTLANGYATFHLAKSEYGHKGPYYIHAHAYDAADNHLGYVGVGKGGKTIMLPAGKAYHDGHIYYVVDKMATFDTAEAWASKYRGEVGADGMRCHLVTIDSAEEQRVVSDLVSQSAYPYHWVGLTDRDTEGQFSWVTGESMGYANWASGDPNGGESENHVLLATSDGKWRDAPNETSLGEDQPIGYVVEFDPLYTDYDGDASLLSDPGITYDSEGLGFTVSVRVGDEAGVAKVQFPTWAASDRSDIRWYEGSVEEGIASCHVDKADFGHKGPFYVSAYARDASDNVLQVLDVSRFVTVMLPAGKATLDGHTYYVVDKAATYTTAEAWARSYRGDPETIGMTSHLVTIGGADEQQVIASLAAKADYPVHWIGLTDEDSEGEFRWVNGEQVGYTNWGAGEPNGGASENYVAFSTDDGAWTDMANVSKTQAGEQPIGYIVEFEPLVAMKPISEKTIPYTGEEQSAIQPGVGFSLSGDLSARKPGTYTTTATLEDGYTWEDGSTDAVVCVWSITKASGNSLTVSDLEFTYDKHEHHIAEPVAMFENSNILFSFDREHWTSDSPEFYDAGEWTVYIKATNECYEDTEIVEAKVTGIPATLVATYQDETIEEGETPEAVVSVTGFLDGDDEDEFIAYEAPIVVLPNQLTPGTYSLTPMGGVATNYVFQYVAGTLTVVEKDQGSDGWVDLPGGKRGYRRDGELVTGWMDLDGAKCWFHEDGAMAVGWLDLGDMKYWFAGDGAMAVGWTDVEQGGKVMYYYFNPASGNLVRDTWFEIGGYKYYFRPSGNVAHGWATISDAGVDKKYYFDDEYHLVTGWRDIDTGQGYAAHYYFRPSGSMATGWATIDGEKYWFRASGNMATGFATVDDAYKRYFDADGHMLTGWQVIGGKTYYFRASGAMQTGEMVLDGVTYVFSDSGTLRSVVVAAQSGDDAPLAAQAEGAPDLAALEAAGVEVTYAGPAGEGAEAE